MHVAFGERENREERWKIELEKKDGIKRDGERKRLVASSEKKRNDLSKLCLIFRLKKHTNPAVQTPADFYFPCICYQPRVLYPALIMAQ